MQEAGGGLHGAQREGEQVGGARGAAEQVQHELERGVVGPVEVVEEQRDGAFAAEHLDQGAQRAVAAEALAGAGGGRGGAGDGGRGERGGEVGADGLDAPRVHGGDVVVERVDHEPERHVALVLGGAPVEDQQAGGRRALVQRVEQRALADAGLAEHREHAALSAEDVGDGAVGGGELALAADQAGRRSGGRDGHAAASVLVSASNDSMVATSPSQPEKSVSVPSGAGDPPGQGVVGDPELECEVDLSLFHGSQHPRCARPCHRCTP